MIPLTVLGVESSCDETSAAVVRGGRTVLSNVVSSQIKLHQPFRGVVPEIASRAHVEDINDVVARALSDADAGTVRSPKGIDAVSVTVGPGLVGSLLVGKMTAEALGWAWNVPVVGVNHLEGHLISPLLAHAELEPPFLGLIVSGGHTDIVHVMEYGRYHVLGRSRDDSVGECFDKVSSLLGLGYPGGPAIDRLAREGNPAAVPFSRPYLRGSWDFSFSGIKTAVLYFLRDVELKKQKAVSVADLCASFQAAVVDVLVDKALKAAKELNLERVAVGGGVSANSELRSRFERDAEGMGVHVYFPSKDLSTDNAAMIASAGAFMLMGKKIKAELSVNPSLAIADWEK